MITPQDQFISRHIGPNADETKSMLTALGCNTLDELISKVVPDKIRFKGKLNLGEYTQPRSERDTLNLLRDIVSQNKVYRTFIGCGYSNCITPPVILRNILENPGWYTQYTPYQAEISQGRLEALLNFQTMVSDLTGLPVSNASLLDEGTAAAEAMTMSYHAVVKDEAASNLSFFVADNCHPQTIAVLKTRAEVIGIKVVVGNVNTTNFASGFFGVLLQYPGTLGEVTDYKVIIAAAHQGGALVTLAADILALAVLTSPGELGADIAVGSAQRFGVPYGFGGPHAAFFSTKDEYKRLMPGRLIGVSKDNAGNTAMRLSLQTREQHIRREKATSNICTAQVLLAIMASMYAVYHGPKGVKRIAQRVLDLTATLAGGLKSFGFKLHSEAFFDTVSVNLSQTEKGELLKRALARQINLRETQQGITIALDETTSESDVLEILSIFGESKAPKTLDQVKASGGIPASLLRKSAILTHKVFNSYHSETEFLRYVRRLESKDLSLGTAMIPLGSCTMKLNATTEMIPVTWSELGSIHPFAPADQGAGYRKLFKDLEQMLCAVTGFDAVSLQPNAGSQGEYAGLLAIRGLHINRGNEGRTICLIPKSAHGTNPASAAMAGMQVVVVACDEKGNIDLNDLRAKAEEHKSKLSCMMVTYPSTHGVFEEEIKECCEIVHRAGGFVYMDGANLNALVGLVRPADIGADVCHINLHKTFCIPHGGGGPGMGPIACRAELAPFLPTHPLVDVGVKTKGAPTGPVSSGPWGSASILVISWAYIVMTGAEGLKAATEYAILNANYISHKLEQNYPTLYRGKNGYVAHECILDCREIKKNTGIEVEDIAKRLMDYCFHAPTVSFPVVGTLMVEPTESESLYELNRFCEAMNQIAIEIKAIQDGKADKTNNALKNAPHTAAAVTATEWTKPYSREEAAFPTKFTKQYKFWPAVGRVDGNYGDRNFICTCPPIETYTERG